MQDPYNKPVKYYRTAKDAFKDADYACALDVEYHRRLPWWAVPVWVTMVLLFISFALVIAHFSL